MDDQTKIQLSTFEMELLQNSEWILTKNNIIRKAQRLLERVQMSISEYTKLNSNVFPPEVISVSPKISKGENYKGLPWLMLDYPRYFSKENIFAIRTMFWWGNFFSTTLHLSGVYKNKYHDFIIKTYEELCKNEFYSCINEEQWDHHLEEENYLPVKNFSAKEFAEHIKKKGFIKLSQKLSLTEWEQAEQLLFRNFIRITEWLH